MELLSINPYLGNFLAFFALLYGVCVMIYFVMKLVIWEHRAMWPHRLLKFFLGKDMANAIVLEIVTRQNNIFREIFRGNLGRDKFKLLTKGEKLKIKHKYGILLLDGEVSGDQLIDLMYLDGDILLGNTETDKDATMDIFNLTNYIDFPYLKKYINIVRGLVYKYRKDSDIEKYLYDYALQMVEVNKVRAKLLYVKLSKDIDPTQTVARHRIVNELLETVLGEYFGGKECINAAIRVAYKKAAIEYDDFENMHDWVIEKTIEFIMSEHLTKPTLKSIELVANRLDNTKE